MEIRMSAGRGDWLENVAVQDAMPLLKVMVQLGETCPPSAVKLTTVPAGTGLPFLSAA
jgi:hypothetical protein